MNQPLKELITQQGRQAAKKAAFYEDMIERQTKSIEEDHKTIERSQRSIEVSQKLIASCEKHLAERNFELDSLRKEHRQLVEEG